MLRLLTDRLGAGKKDFTAAHYRALETLAQTGGALSLPGGASAVCRDGALTLSDAPAPLDEAALRPGDNLAGLWRITLSDAPVPDALALRSGPWTVRPWRRDDRLTLPGSRGSRSLKRLFAERGIAPPERDTWPVLCLAGSPAAVWRVGIDQKALPECSGNTIYITITKNNGG